MAAKIQLPNGCYRSQMSVHPKNWETKNASIKETWYISYRFYDPSYPNPKQRIIKGMNEFKTLEERQAATRELIDNELNLLHNHGYHPFTGECITVEEGDVGSAGQRRLSTCDDQRESDSKNWIEISGKLYAPDEVEANLEDFRYVDIDQIILKDPLKENDWEYRRIDFAFNAKVDSVMTAYCKWKQRIDYLPYYPL